MYTEEDLRQIFQRPFDKTAWNAIQKNLFHATTLRQEWEQISEPDSPETGYYFGKIATSDNFEVGLFYYRINKGSVAHKKVGLRRLVHEFVQKDSGIFDAAIVVFDDKKEWRLSLICDIQGEATAPKRFTFVFGEHDNRYRTAVERFVSLQKEEPTFKNIRKAFSVESLSDEFFDRYRELYADFVEYLTGKRYVKEGGKFVERKRSEPDPQFESSFYGDDKLVRDYVKKMFGRIVFLYFLQRKGWLDGNRQYMHDLFANSYKKDDFLDGVLEPLFFNVLNEKPENRPAEAKELPGSENIPYLNGGLFARDPEDEQTCKFPKKLFQELFDFLDSYNFTIDENDTDDAEIGIDPEMLGRIFENLLEDNKDKGAFYTPKEIVDYMCRESIIAYLNNGIPEESHTKIRKLVENLDASDLNDEQCKYLRKKLQEVKICDPAIGSGAFPMGLVNLLSKLYVAMKADTDTVKMKRHIMERNIYGVDIEKGAVDIARLRFWLAMIVEEPKPIPLPNLHFKIMQGNSLLEWYQGKDLSDMTKIMPKPKPGVDLFGNPMAKYEVGDVFNSDNAEREELISYLRAYYKESDHAERDHLFNEIINNVRRQLHSKGIELPEGFDPSANEDFFLWHTWFTDVFTNGGFDIVIGNPPYVIVSKDDKNKDVIDNSYRIAKGGKRNLYHLFFEKGIKILKDKGVLAFITPDTYIAGNDTKKLREFFLDSINIIEITLYTEKDKVFKNVTQAVAVSLLQKTIKFTDLKLVSHGKIYSIKKSEIISDPKYRFIALNHVIRKIQEAPKKFSDVIKGLKGDVNLGIKKSYFRNIEEPDSLPLVRGVQISPYYFMGSEQWCLKDAISQTNTYTDLERICFLEVSNAGLERRIKATILKDVILGDSVNFIIPKDDNLSLETLLGIVNSKVVNYYFKYFNQTNHVPIGEFKSIPFPEIDMQSASILKKLTHHCLEMKNKSVSADISKLEEIINLLVYKLYHLSVEEVRIIDNDFKLSENEYNKYQINNLNDLLDSSLE